MPASDSVHPQQFYDWYGGSDEAIAHLQAFTAKQDAMTAAGAQAEDEANLTTWHEPGEEPYTDKFGKTWDPNTPVDPSEERQFLK